MPKKKSYSIGTDVLNKAKDIVPSKVELTIKPPSPVDFIQLKLEWEREEGRKLSEEELSYRLEEYMKKLQEKKLKRQLKMPRQVKYV